MGYFIEWGIYGRNFKVKDVKTSGSADKLTVINYAFGNVAPDSSGNVVCQIADPWADYQKPWDAPDSVTDQAVTSGPLLGNFQQLQALKEQYPHLKVLISIGGWTFSKYFSDAALTKQSRERFVSSCVDLFIKGNLPSSGEQGGPGAAAGVFDGIDIDWEWPGSEGNVGNIIRPQDKQNYTRLLQEFRKQLRAYGKTTHKDYLLTAFLPAAADKIRAGFEVPDIFGPLDFGNVQGYDFHGTWEPTTNHQSNLSTSSSDPSSPRYSDDAVVREYLRRDAPPKRIVVGVPFYSRGWTGVAAANSGLYQQATGAAPGTWEPGVEDYKVAKQFLSNGIHEVPGRPGRSRVALRRNDLLDVRRSTGHGGQGGLRPAESARRDHVLGAERRHAGRRARLRDRGRPPVRQASARYTALRRVHPFFKSPCSHLGSHRFGRMK